MRSGDQYRSKPEMAAALLRELVDVEFKLEVVWADCR